MKFLATLLAATAVMAISSGEDVSKRQLEECRPLGKICNPAAGVVCCSNMYCQIPEGALPVTPGTVCLLVFFHKSRELTELQQCREEY